MPPELSGAERKEEVIGERVEFEVKIMSDGKLRAQAISRLFSEGDSAPSRGPGAEPAELSELEDDVVQEMADHLADCGNGQDYGKFSNRFPRVKKRKIEKHFDIITEEGGRQRVELPPDHPQRVEPPEEPLPESLPEESEAKEEPREDVPYDDFPEEAEETRPEDAPVEDDVDPNEPAIPLGHGVQPMGVIRDYDAVKGFGFIRVENHPEDIFFPRSALPKSFQASDNQEMPALKGVQVTFDLNESNSRGPRTDSLKLLLRWLQSDRCWLLKRVRIPPRPARNRS
ncbi:PRDX5 [Symbiodinium pilosum]|uniref:PRDX5 protein n=1 Tax=Symbiodinium pilosum TaxID=2952 RepID=A0A812KTX7_SYMPI|nr:PRDX5 [Symbiodinium pilosum]